MWCTIDDIAESNIGLTYKPTDICSNGIPVYRSNNIQNRKICLQDIVRVNANILEKQYLHEGDLLICARNGSRNLVGKCAIIQELEEPTSFGAFMAVCRSKINKWIFFVLNTEYFNDYLDDSNSTTINQVTQKMLLAFNLPIPPLKEQMRIEKEIERWFSIIDNIEKEKTDLNLYISQIKSKILDLAISGKLVPQDPTDEPAINLLKRINPNFKPCDNSHYENVPLGWSVCKLKDIFDITMGQSPEGDTINYDNGIEFHQGKIYFTDKYLSCSNTYTGKPTKIADINSLLLCVRAPVGVLNITQREICIGRGLSSLKPRYDIDIQYWFYILSNYKDYFESQATGSTFKAISGDTIRNTIISLPPKEEQKRIADKISQIWDAIDTITAEL